MASALKFVRSADQNMAANNRPLVYIIFFYQIVRAIKRIIKFLIFLLFRCFKK